MDKKPYTQNEQIGLIQDLLRSQKNMTCRLVITMFQVSGGKTTRVCQ